MIAVLGAAAFREGLLASLEALRASRASIDAVNVYPVPDGDTGTNLVMTLEAVAHALASTGDTDEDVARAVRTGSLMGARGNSGVILAQILRAWADAVEYGPADVEGVARAFKRAVELAYEAVLVPAEGTILSVARAAADGAQGDHATVADVFASATKFAADGLARTPEEMPLLAAAGVVDAGGLGLVIILDAFARSLGADGIPIAIATPASAVMGSECEGPSLTFAYEVQYVLQSSDESIPAFRELLGTIGDSVAVIGGNGSWRVHVHTNDRARAVALGEAIGTVSDIEEVSFAQQIAGLATPGGRGVGIARAATTATLVAAVHGEGLRRLFEDLGAVTVAVDARDEEIRAVLSDAPTGHIIFLPNDPVLASRTLPIAATVAGNVSVLPAHDPAAGLAAAVAYGDARSARDNVEDMLAALGTTRTTHGEDRIVRQEDDVSG
ncbi:MAG TPA: DAK2 domain-containing protein, partial [Actinomycetota bacterium]|nr:DAK2 domain-containing protein [Actinomycetota bacterium]